MGTSRAQLVSEFFILTSKSDNARVDTVERTQFRRLIRWTILFGIEN